MLVPAQGRGDVVALAWVDLQRRAVPGNPKWYTWTFQRIPFGAVYGFRILVGMLGIEPKGELAWKVQVRICCESKIQSSLYKVETISGGAKA